MPAKTSSFSHDLCSILIHFHTASLVKKRWFWTVPQSTPTALNVMAQCFLPRCYPSSKQHPNARPWLNGLPGSEVEILGGQGFPLFSSDAFLFSSDAICLSWNTLEHHEIWYLFWGFKIVWMIHCFPLSLEVGRHCNKGRFLKYIWNLI